MASDGLKTLQRSIGSEDSETIAIVSDNLSTFLASSTYDLDQPQITEESKSSYFNFFLSELRKYFPYVNLFPRTAAILFSSSNHHPDLRECVLAVAALSANQGLEGEKEAPAHSQKALQVLKARYSNVEADDALVIFNFFLAHLSLMLGDGFTAREHLKGMSVIMNKLDCGRGVYTESAPSSLTIDKLTSLIWRMAIQIDFISSVACGKAPALPRSQGPHLANFSLPEEEEGVHRQWIQANEDTEISPHHADWADAWFSLDALMHRSCHASATVISLRSQPGPTSENQIQTLMNTLMESRKQWRERRVVSKSDIIGAVDDLINIDQDDMQFTSHEPPRKAEGFLKYYPMHILDPFVASRLNNWRAIFLHINLIQEPMWGLYLGSRFVCAVDLCRTHAALGVKQNVLGAETAVGLYLAGVAFGGPDMYPAESEWVLNQLGEIKAQHPIATTLKDNLEHIWKLKGNYWDAINKVSEK